MGIYNDNSGGVRREAWLFGYKGSELLAAAESKARHYQAEENKQRELMAGYMVNKTLSIDSREVKDTQRAIAVAGDLHEKCTIWAHEFRRQGHAKELIGIAMSHFAHLSFSPDQSELGKMLVDSFTTPKHE